MTKVELYVSMRRIYDGSRCLGAMAEVSFDPIEGAEFLDQFGALRHVIEPCSRPSLTVGLGGRWQVTREHGVTNVAVEGDRIVVPGIPRDFLPPMAVLVFARSGRGGARIIAGRDPFPAETSDLEAITQRTLFAVGA